jgi:hypothetical protein
MRGRVDSVPTARDSVRTDSGRLRFAAFALTLFGAAAPFAHADRFDAVFARADRVGVVEHDFRHDREVSLYDSSSVADLEALRGALRATPEEGICACLPSIEIRLYRGNDLVATVGYLGARVKGELWQGDAELVSHEELLRWFETRGMDGPREDALAEEERDRAFDRSEALWLAAMPASLRSAWRESWEDIRQDPTPFRVPGPWRTVIEGEHPDVVDRAAVLLRWYGYGGPWSGHASFETGPRSGWASSPPRP